MKMKILKCMTLVLAMACIFCFPVTVSATSQGTDGTEMQVMQPEKLEIQLGEEWAGVEFELKTDAGMYPGTIPVGDDGVLRLEIGGSSTYILTCINSSVEMPVPGETSPAAEGESETESKETTTAPDSSEESEVSTEMDPTDAAPDDGKSGSTIAGIPVANLAMFGGGLLVAIGALVGISIHNKRKEATDVDENDEF